MSYEPQAGTLAHRGLEYLRKQDRGAMVSSAQIAEALDVDAVLIVPSFKQCIAAGLVRRTTKPDNLRLAWWSLGDGKPLITQAEEPDLLPHRSNAPDVQPQPGQMFPGVRGDEVVERVKPDRYHEVVQPSAPALNVPKFTGEAVARPDTAGGRPMTLHEVAAAEHTQQPFDCWLSGVSGELVLQGVATNEDGDPVLPPEQVAAVRRVLLGVPA